VQFGADFKKLVQIGRHDAQVAQALQQGDIGAPSPVQNPLIKAQDAFIPVKQWEVVGAVWGKCVHSGSIKHTRQWTILIGAYI
jgi:hypothetical protein